MFKKVLEHVGVGLAIGAVASTACMALLGGLDGTLIQVMAWLAASALMGIVSLIYDIEALSLPLAIGLHAALCFGISLGTGYLLGYGEYFGPRFALLMLPCFLLIYLVVSLCIWLYGRHYARTTSERLAKK